MLHVRVAAEVLPVRILYPTIYHRFIRFVERVLEVLHPDHQPDSLGRCPHVLAVTARESRVEPQPVNLLGQLNQLVLMVEHLVEMSLE
jgi:hypothetical protein